MGRTRGGNRISRVDQLSPLNKTQGIICEKYARPDSNHGAEIGFVSPFEENRQFFWFRWLAKEIGRAHV
jgi:hypothetical protein